MIDFVQDPKNRAVVAGVSGLLIVVLVIVLMFEAGVVGSGANRASGPVVTAAQEDALHPAQLPQGMFVPGLTARQASAIESNAPVPATGGQAQAGPPPTSFSGQMALAQQGTNPKP